MKGYIYIMTNTYNSVLYTGVTSDLRERVIQHKTKKHPKSFSARYNTIRLVYYERLQTMGEAIKREKQLKGGNRKKKEDLIESVNPEWKDLFESLDG